jgi:hypothetical protein
MFSVKKSYEVEIISQKMVDKGCQFVYPNNIIENISNQNHKICHIIGSGWSLNDSLKKVEKDSYVMGYNFAAFSDLNFDFYFVENAGVEPSTNKLRFKSIIQYMLVNETIISKTNDIYFKNIWQFPNTVNEMVNLYADKLKFVRDVIIFSNKTNDARYIVAYMLQEDKRYIKQICSTNLTCIALAAMAGFKKIVVHGVDFFGPNFFDMESFVNVRKTELPCKSTKKYTYKDLKLMNIHGTMKDAIPHSILIKEFCNILKTRGVTLMSASKKSPLSKILPLFQC